MLQIKLYHHQRIDIVSGLQIALEKYNEKLYRPGDFLLW